MTNSAHESSAPDSPTPASTKSTCESCEGKTSRQLTLFAAGHPANPFHWPGSDAARETTATSGRKCLGLYENLTHNPAPFFLRMLLGASIYFSPKFYLTWLLRDIPGVGALRFHLRHSEPDISDIVSSCWPTPTASDDANRKPGNPHLTKNGTIRHVNAEGKQSFMRLSQVVKLEAWPTPTVNGNHNRKGASPTSGDGLSTAVKASPWATPQSRDYRGGSKQDSARMKRKAEQGWSSNLNDQVLETAEGALNPDWELDLMGFPPGWLDLDGPHGEDNPNTIGSRPAP